MYIYTSWSAFSCIAFRFYLLWSVLFVWHWMWYVKTCIHYYKTIVWLIIPHQHIECDVEHISTNHWIWHGLYIQNILNVSRIISPKHIKCDKDYISTTHLMSQVLSRKHIECDADYISKTHWMWRGIYMDHLDNTLNVTWNIVPQYVECDLVYNSTTHWMWHGLYLHNTFDVTWIISLQHTGY